MGEWPAPVARETREFEEKCASRPARFSLSLGSVALFVTGFAVGAFLQQVALGVLLFAVGAILFAVRGYLNTGDKAVAAALVYRRAGGYRNTAHRTLSRAVTKG